MKRHEAREKAFQTLFQLDSTDMTVEEAIEYIMEGKTDAFYDVLVQGTHKNRADIDLLLKQNLEKWSLDRLPKTERTILRIAIFELEYLDDAPDRVILNEAIELSKSYGDDQSPKFVNGVLSKFTDRKGE
ncbi:transcription antitermination factor NusB [Indiicoccus explosivorum]|uniref:transcription antitermination factor NusB n=1 Tax=Indiicoccus explosivorum TaxID=1917864 RepID=UPI000B449E6B|nr:transcription antitermination factor NusB [Indiicoccus explosivorum]